jgi:hypothetical protein
MSDDDTMKEVLARRDFILSGRAKAKAMAQLFDWAQARGFDAIKMLHGFDPSEDWAAAFAQAVDLHVFDATPSWTAAAEAMMLRDLQDLNYHALVGNLMPLVSAEARAQLANDE